MVRLRRARAKEPRYLECRGTSELTGFDVTNIITRHCGRTDRGAVNATAAASAMEGF